MLHQFLLGINTAMPGDILSYDAETRRADVRGALAVVLNDGTQVDRPVISNVPVLFPASGFMDRMGGFLQSFPLMPGDPVLLVFSMRGLARWKLTNGRLSIGDMAPIPDVDSMLSERDAIAIPGFGPEAGNLPPEGWPSVEITVEDDNLLRLRVKDPADTMDMPAHRTVELGPDHIRLDFDIDAERRRVEITEDHMLLDFSEAADRRRMEITADHVLLDLGEGATQRQVEITADHVKAQVGAATVQREIVLTENDATIRVGATVHMVLTETGITIMGGTVSIAGSTVTVDGSSAVTITGATTVNGVSVADQTAGTNSQNVGNHGSHSHTLTVA